MSRPRAITIKDVSPETIEAKINEITNALANNNRNSMIVVTVAMLSMFVALIFSEFMFTLFGWFCFTFYWAYYRRRKHLLIEDLYAIKYFLEHVLSGGLEKEDSE
jgi:hypothetical protein